MRFVAFALLLLAPPAFAQAIPEPASEPASAEVVQAREPGPIRFGLWIAPVVPIGFRQERFAGSGQLFLEYWLSPYVGLRAAAGLGSASTAFLVADVGATFDFLADGLVIPYAEVTVGMFGWLNNVAYPEANEGRSVISFAPAAGLGARLFKTGTSFGLGVFYRYLLDGSNAVNPSRVHSLLEIRLSLSFR